MLLKAKGLFPVKLKTFVKKFRKFNAYNNLDKKLLKYLNYQNGFFFDIGANDGVNQSTTWYFEKFLNWKGILVEPLSHVYAELVKNRSSKNYFFNCAAVSKNYKSNYINLIYNDDTLTTKLQILEKGKIKEDKKLIKVRTQTIENILEQSIPHTKIIDFFSLDVEGAEFEVLNGINFKKNPIKFILIETSCFKKLESFLLKKNFKFVSRLSNYNLSELPDYGDYLFKNNKYS
jgi:FkbM family methyltransferase